MIARSASSITLTWLSLALFWACDSSDTTTDRVPLEPSVGGRANPDPNRYPARPAPPVSPPELEPSVRGPYAECTLEPEPSGAELNWRPLTAQPAERCFDPAWGAHAPGHRLPYPPSNLEASCSNYVEPPKVGDDFELHVVGVYESAAGQHGHGLPRVAGPVEVILRATEKPVVLALSSYEPVSWNIVLRHGAVLAAVITSGYYTQTVSGVNAPLFELGRGELCGYAYGWETEFNRGGGRFIAMRTALEAYTGLQTRSFSGCYAGERFEVPHAYCPEVDASKPVGGDETKDNRRMVFPGCGSIQAESAWCMVDKGGDLALVGLDSGSLCSTGAATPYPAVDSGLLWRGEIVYTCHRAGLTRTSLVDGRSETLQIPCLDVEYDHQSETFHLFTGFSHSNLGGWLGYDSYEALREGVGRPLSISPWATRFSLNDGVLYGTWHSTHEALRLEVSTGRALSPTPLGGYDGWTFGVSATKSLLVFTTLEGLRAVRLDTGETHRILDDGRLAHTAIACVEG